MINQSNCFILKHFYIVKEKGPVKKLKLTSLFILYGKPL